MSAEAVGYVSTRGRAPRVGFREAVLAGLAPDGGLYVPDQWPRLEPADIAALAARPYAEAAAAIVGRLAGDALGPEALAEMCADAYAGFSHAAVAPLRQLSSGGFLLELFHGPTLAFKDVALQLLARLYDHLLARAGRRITIVCATSGDTGGAAIEAFRGRANVRIAVLYPQGRVSEVQRRFMTTADEGNVACLAVAGDFDDCQAMLKAMFADAAFAAAVGLAAVNSINFARIAAQAVYYFTSAVALGAPHRPVSFSVPSGNFGDAYAGYAAQRMGLPIDRIVVAVNANDILRRALEGGRYARAAAVATSSPAMDIQAASNFERLYFETVERELMETARAFEAFAAQGGFEVPPRALGAMRRLFSAAAVSESEVARTILATYNDCGVLIDPHTAVGLAGARRAPRGADAGPAPPMVILATAHPAKFPEVVTAAAGVAPTAPHNIHRLGGRPERIRPIAADAEAAKAFVRGFAA